MVFRGGGAGRAVLPQGRGGQALRRYEAVRSFLRSKLTQRSISTLRLQ